MSNSPIRVTSSEDSRERVLYGLMAFQRWAKSQNRNTPSALVEGLGEYGLEMSISNLDLGNSFHLVRWVRGDSSQAVQMFDFRVNEPDTIRVRYVKRTDNDRHTFNIRTGKVHSIKGNWMSGDRESQSVMETPRVASAYELLLEQWISPRNWCREGRFVVIRPKDLPTNDDDVVPKVRGVTLCKSAVGLLRNGYTLLLVKGDLIQIPLPKERRYLMLIAGLFFKEGQPQHSTEAPQPGRRGQTPQRPDDLGFIIPERAHRRTQFTGILADYADSTKPGQQFVGGMYDWSHHDLYRYVPGAWQVGRSVG